MHFVLSLTPFSRRSNVVVMKRQVSSVGARLKEAASKESDRGVFDGSCAGGTRRRRTQKEGSRVEVQL